MRVSRFVHVFRNRLEAIGMIGVERCYSYTLRSNKPLFNENTPTPRTEEEIWEFATEQRYSKYHGGSDTMIDHFYDKLLRLGAYPIRNPYFDDECEKRQRPLIDFLLKFGNGEIRSQEDIKEYIRIHMND